MKPLRWLIFGLAGLTLTCVLLTCLGSDAVKPPFFRGNVINWERKGEFSGGRSITGSGVAYVEWQLKASSDAITEAISSKEVRDRLVWKQVAGTEEFSSFRDYYKTSYERARIETLLRNYLSDPESMYACEEIRTSSRGLERATIWLCSPGKKLLVYLDVSG